jgi:hypothetical protein
MTTLAALTVWGGIILLLLGHLFFIIAAFRESILWGLAVLFLPIVPLIFLIVHWGRAKGPFFMELWGVVLMLIGILALDGQFPIHH